MKSKDNLVLKILLVVALAVGYNYSDTYAAPTLSWAELRGLARSGDPESY